MVYIYVRYVDGPAIANPLDAGHILAHTSNMARAQRMLPTVSRETSPLLNAIKSGFTNSLYKNERQIN